METIGVFLKKLRGKRTFREVAEKSGLSHSYIRYLELGKRPGSNAPINPTPDTLMRLSKAYDYPYEELMQKAGYLLEGTENKSEGNEELMADFKRLSEEDKKYLIGLIKRMPKEY